METITVTAIYAHQVKKAVFLNPDYIIQFCQEDDKTRIETEAGGLHVTETPEEIDNMISAANKIARGLPFPHF